MLAAADAVLIPIQCEYYALRDTQLMNTVQMVRKHLNPRLAAGRRAHHARFPHAHLRGGHPRGARLLQGERVRDGHPRNVKLSEAPSHGIPINFYDPKSRGAEAHAQLAAEVMQRGEKGTR